MNNETKTIKNGTAVFCRTAGFHYEFGQVVDTITDEWGTHYDVCVTLVSNKEYEGNRVAKFKRVSRISDADKKGIGWKLADAHDIRIANLRMK